MNKEENLKELSGEKFEELKSVGYLGNKYLEKYCHPHTTIEINEDGIYLRENLFFIPWENIKLDDKDESCQ